MITRCGSMTEKEDLRPTIGNNLHWLPYKCVQSGFDGSGEEKDMITVIFERMAGDWKYQLLRRQHEIMNRSIFDQSL